MIIGFVLSTVSTMFLGLWVFILVMNAHRDRETIMAKDRIIHEQQVYIEINLGVLIEREQIIKNLRVLLDKAEKQLYT